MEKKNVWDIDWDCVAYTLHSREMTYNNIEFEVSL